MLFFCSMVETRSGLSVEPEPEQSPEGSAHDLSPAGRGDTAATRRGTASPRRRRGKHEGASSSHELTDSQAYTLLSLALGLMALPCIFTPKLVGDLPGQVFGAGAAAAERQPQDPAAPLPSAGLQAARMAFGSAAYPPEDQHTHTLVGARGAGVQGCRDCGVVREAPAGGPLAGANAARCPPTLCPAAGPAGVRPAGRRVRGVWS